MNTEVRVGAREPLMSNDSTLRAGYIGIDWITRHSEVYGLGQLGISRQMIPLTGTFGNPRLHVGVDGLGRIPDRAGLL